MKAFGQITRAIALVVVSAMAIPAFAAERVTTEICGWAEPRKEMKRVEKVERGLLNNGYATFANRIGSTCGSKK
jgi:hypothetical protein